MTLDTVSSADPWVQWPGDSSSASCAGPIAIADARDASREGGHEASQAEAGDDQEQVVVEVPSPAGELHRPRQSDVFGQFIRMRWGRITEIHTIEDTQTLVRALDSLAASGNAEAHTKPITDADDG